MYNLVQRFQQSYFQIFIVHFCYTLILQVFPPLPCRGKLLAKLQAVPAEDVQSECFYPSCDLATPPFTPALEGEDLHLWQLSPPQPHCSLHTYPHTHTHSLSHTLTFTCTFSPTRTPTYPHTHTPTQPTHPHILIIHSGLPAGVQWKVAR